MESSFDPLGMEMSRSLPTDDCEKIKRIILKFINDKSYRQDRRLLQLIISFCEHPRTCDEESDALYAQVLDLEICKFSSQLYLHLSNYYENRRRSPIQAEHILRIGLSHEAEPMFLLKQALESIISRSGAKKSTASATRRGYNAELLGMVPGSDIYCLSFEEARSKLYLRSVAATTAANDVYISEIPATFVESSPPSFPLSFNDENSPFLDANFSDARAPKVDPKSPNFQNEKSVLSISSFYDVGSESECAISASTSADRCFAGALDNYQSLEIVPVQHVTLESFDEKPATEASPSEKDCPINEDEIVLIKGDKKIVDSVIRNEPPECVDMADGSHVSASSLTTSFSTFKALCCAPDFQILNEKDAKFCGTPLVRLMLFLEFCHALSPFSSHSGRKSILPRKSFSSKAADFSKLSTDIYPFLLIGEQYRFVQKLPNSSYLIQEFSSLKQKLSFFILRKVDDFSSAKNECQASILINDPRYQFRLLCEGLTEYATMMGKFTIVLAPFVSQYAIKDVVETANAISPFPDEIIALQLVRSVLNLLADIHRRGVAHGSFSCENILFVLNDDDDDDSDDEMECEGEAGNNISSEFFSLAFSDFSSCRCNGEISPLIIEKERTLLRSLISYIIQANHEYFFLKSVYKEAIWDPILADISVFEGLFGECLRDKYIPVIDALLGRYQGFPSPLSKLQRISILLYEL